MSLLSVKDLTKTYRTGFWPLQKVITTPIVKGISFDLAPNEILGFLGPNGAGKTTTIQMLLGTLLPTSGQISYFGKDFFAHREALLQRIGYASGYDKLPARLTVQENLDSIGRMYGLDKKQRSERIAYLLDMFLLGNLLDRETGSLSAGQATRVMLAKAFLAEPAIVLLDEPTASLDPDVAHEVRKFILAQRKERGTAFLITSHNMDEVTELCDRVLVLKEGIIIANESPQTLANSTAKVRVHLTFTSDLSRAAAYFADSLFSYTVEKQTIIITLDELSIAPLLIKLSEQRILFSHIAIDKPTLEDYFLTIASTRGSL